MNMMLRTMVSGVFLGGIVWYIGGLQQIGGAMAEMTILSIFVVLAISTLDRVLMTF